MKKLLLLIIFIIISPVSALEYSIIPCQSINNINTKERRYAWYKEEIQQFYFRENENTKEYPFIDKSNTKLSSFSIWNEEKPKEMKNRKIEERNIFMYREINPVQYLFLFNLKGSNQKLYINEIELYDNGMEIPFTISCNKCSKDFSEVVTNKNIYYENSYAKEDSIIQIGLENKEYKNLTVRILLYDDGYETKKVEARATHEKNIEDVYYDYASQRYFTHSTPKQFESVIIYLNKMRKVNPKFGEEKISLVNIEETENRKVEKKKQYRYRDTLFRYYRMDRKYLDSYSVSSPGDMYHKDEKKYKDYYLCTSKESFYKKEEIKLENKIEERRLKKIDAKDFSIKKDYSTKITSNCPVYTNDSGKIKKVEKDLLICKKSKQKIFFWIFLFLLVIIIYELYKKHSRKN